MKFEINWTKFELLLKGSNTLGKPYSCSINYLDICNEIKIQIKVQKHSNLHKREMKTFCFQYGFEKVKEPGSSSRKFRPKNYNMRPTYYRKSRRYNKSYTPKRYHKYSNSKKPAEKQQNEVKKRGKLK